MKRLVFLMALGLTTLTSYAQINVHMQTACNPQDVKTYDTERLRSSFLMEKVMSPNEINLTYSMYDRFIFGGAMPVSKELSLDTFDALKAPYFLYNRELGVINVGGEGIVTVDGKEYTFDGIVNGSITTEKRGDSGFGYDPIFMPDTYTQTFAEMGNDTKNQISHRAKAVMKLTSFLSDYNC